MEYSKYVFHFGAIIFCSLGYILYAKKQSCFFMFRITSSSSPRVVWSWIAQYIYFQGPPLLRLSVTPPVSLTLFYPAVTLWSSVTTSFCEHAFWSPAMARSCWSRECRLGLWINYVVMFQGPVTHFLKLIFDTLLSGLNDHLGCKCPECPYQGIPVGQKLSERTVFSIFWFLINF